jgi:hypothetical protein
MNSWNTCSKKQFVQQIVSWARSGKCQIFASIKQMNEHESEDECERKIMKDSKSMDEPFPLKLHRMLGEVENTSDQGILSWGPSGHCFIIFQPKMFATRIMGEYFRQTKYKSFQRQLNLYGVSAIPVAVFPVSPAELILLYLLSLFCQVLSEKSVARLGAYVSEIKSFL